MSGMPTPVAAVKADPAFVVYILRALLKEGKFICHPQESSEYTSGVFDALDYLEAQGAIAVERRYYGTSSHLTIKGEKWSLAYLMSHDTRVVGYSDLWL